MVEHFDADISKYYTKGARAATVDAHARDMREFQSAAQQAQKACSADPSSGACKSAMERQMELSSRPV